MERRIFLTGAAALAASPVLAQTAAPTQPPVVTPAPVPTLPPVPEGAVRVVMKTKIGDLTMDLRPDKAPITAGNFLRLVDQRRFDGSTFYRAVHPEGVTDFGVVQGGIKADPARPVKPIAHEPTTKTGLSHTNGAISMGRFTPGTATSDFFICVSDQKAYDADPSQPGDNVGYAVFGHVVGGMEVARAILVMPVSPTKGAASGMKGQILEPPVGIISARRV